MEEELRIVFIHYLQKYQILFNYFMQISFWVFISIDSMVQSLKFIKFKDIITLAYKTTEMWNKIINLIVCYILKFK